MAPIEIRGLTRSFPTAGRALDGVDLDIPAGDFLVLLGRSGSGKTTLLRLLAGLDLPDAGTIRVAGSDVTHLPPHRRDVAWVPQRPALYPGRDVAGNLSIGLELRGGVPRAQVAERVAEAADLLGIAHLLRRRPDELSGGEQQRVALGRALVRRAPIWLLDEPLAHLDPPLKRQFRSELPLLHKRCGATILYVTHDPDEAQELGRRLAVLDAGRFLQVGTPADVRDGPDHLTVAELLAGGPLNRLPASLAARLAADSGMPAETVGVVRPEDVSFRPAADGPHDGEHAGAGLCVGGGRVTAVVPAGAGYLLTVGQGDNTWHARRFGGASGPTPIVGEKGDVFLEPGRIHWFDGRTGNRRTPGT